VNGNWPGQALECQKLINNAGSDVLTYDLEKFETVSFEAICWYLRILTLMLKY
jgi:hypothetical protein